MEEKIEKLKELIIEDYTQDARETEIFNLITGMTTEELKQLLEDEEFTEIAKDNDSYKELKETLITIEEGILNSIKTDIEIITRKALLEIKFERDENKITAITTLENAKKEDIITFDFESFFKKISEYNKIRYTRESLEKTYRGL